MEILKIETNEDISESSLKYDIEESWNDAGYIAGVNVNVVRLDKKLYRVELEIDLSGLIYELAVRPKIENII